MHTVWSWFSQNSGSVQAIATLVGIPFTLFTLLFVIKATRAAKSQAYAACRQAEAAENAAEMSIKQIYQSTLSQDRSLKPVLNFDYSDRHQLKIANTGMGAAFNLVVTTGDQRWRCENDVVGVGAAIVVWAGFDPESDDTIIAHYTSLHGRSHECLCGIDADTRFRMQQHTDHGAAYDELAEVTFDPSPECEQLR